jgi:folate-dependent phosphoribosylglycinamide formyltransferase PurN
MLKIAIFAPVDFSLYSITTLTILEKLPNIEIVGIFVRSPFSFSRIKTEWRRDGMRLVKKVYNKMFLKNKRFSANPRTLNKFANSQRVTYKSLKLFAADKNIPYYLSKDINSPEIEHTLRKMGVDLIVFTGGGLIKKNILAIPTRGVFNAHMGILPIYRGMDVVEWPFVELQEKRHPLIGITLHFMDAGVDTGDIVFTRELALLPNDTFKIIRERLEVLMVEMIIEGINAITTNTLVRVQQQIPDGKQYYILHPVLLEFARKKLSQYLKYCKHSF